MNRILNGNPYAVLDKQVGYKEALEATLGVTEPDDIRAQKMIAEMFDHDTDKIRRDLHRLHAGMCIACGDTKIIERRQWNPLNSQWEPHYVDCQECEE